jgi:DMSO/TMAO reductase YedYZ molybdopterin-dependent catalytic subunit
MNAALPQHGAPARLVVPGWYGMTNVKWLSAITAVREPFTGYQQSWSYRLRQDRPRRVCRSPGPRPRAHATAGHPGLLHPRRVVDMGTCRLTGRVWSGGAAIDGVEVSVDDGATWADATVGRADLGPWAWRSWQFDWTPSDRGARPRLPRPRDRGRRRGPARMEPRRLRIRRRSGSQ